MIDSKIAVDLDMQVLGTFEVQREKTTVGENTF